MGIITFRKKIYFIFLCITLFSGFTKSFAQCPTVANSAQSFCDIESPTVSSLMATNNGNGVVWYATATSTTPLSGASGLVNGEDYFADDNSGSCGTRQSVTVTIYSEPAGQNFQGVCVGDASDATISDLIAVGNNIQWYATSTSVTPLSSSTILTDNTIYYASQTNPVTGCETSRLSVFVNVGVVPVPTGPSVQQFCNLPDNTPTVGDLIASGANNWYPTATSAVVLDLSTPLVDGQSYFATTVDPPCESIDRLEVVVDLVEPNNAGTNGTRQICQNQVASTAPFNLFSLLGSAPDTTGTWTGPVATSNGFHGTVNVSAFTLAGSPYVFTYTVSSSLCGPSSSTVTITILPLPTVAISGTNTVCAGNNATVIFIGTPNATVTYTVTGASGSQNITLNGAGTATISTAYSTTTTYTLVSVASSGTPGCSQPAAGSVTITVRPLPVVAIAPNATVCSGSSAMVTFTGTPNATVVYTITGIPGNQDIILNEAGTATITGTFTATTVYTLVSASSSGSPACTQPQTGSVTVTVIPLPIVTISASAVSVCQNGTSTVTFTGPANTNVTYTVTGIPGNQTILLNGAGTAAITTTFSTTTTYTLVSAATTGTPACSQLQNGSVTVTVLPPPTASVVANTTICSGSSATVTFTGTPNATVVYIVSAVTGNQSIVLNGAGTATITNIYTSTTTFTLVSVTSAGSPSCSQPVATSITITVLPLPIVSISESTTICPNQPATVIFTGTPNATITYTVTGVPGNQMIVLNAAGTAAITMTYSATTTYTLVSAATAGMPSCSQPQTGTITITVLPLPTVTITANLTICSGGGATVTFTGTPYVAVTYTVTGIPGNQTIILNASGNASVTGNYTTTTTFTLVSATTSGMPACSQPQTGTVTITVLPPPIASISAATTTICSETSATVAFTGTPNATVIYTVTGVPGNQIIILNAAGTATISNTLATTTTYTLVSVATTGTPSCSQPLNGTVTVTTTPAPNAGNDVANLTLCANSPAVDLFTLLGGSAQTGGTWSPTLASGTGVFNPAVDAATTYTYFVTGNTPCPTDTASVTITILPPPNAGNDATVNICSNANPQDLFLLLGANAQTGGVWAPALVSGTGVFNPAVDAAGPYTYTVTDAAPCGSDNAIVTVEITPGPNAGQDGALTLCVNSLPQNLFNYLSGTPQAGGTWSPTLASGTGVFNPAVDPAGVYTYTFFGNQPCDNDTAIVTVTVNPVPNAGNDATAPFCTNTPPTDLIAFLTGNPQTGGTWAPALASGTGVFNPAVDAATTYTYTIGGNLCSTDTSTVTVAIIQAPIAGGPGATLNTCITSNPMDLMTGLNGSQGAGTWTDNDASDALAGNIFNPLAAGAGTFHFTYTVGGGISPCQFDTATVTVVVSPEPNAGTFAGVQNVCASAGTFDLETLLNNEQTGGTWTDVNNLPITNPLNVSTLTAGTYSYTYTIANACGNDTETVQLTILPSPALAIPNITIITPICLSDNATISFSGMVNGTYAITYSLSGSNILANQSVNVTIAGGTGSLTIPAANITNIGTTTITFINIANSVTNCTTTLTNIQVNFVIGPVSNIDPVNLIASTTCFGNAVPITIANETGLPDGNYQFNYAIPNATPSTGITEIVAISQGNGTFTLPTSTFPIADNYTFTITGISSLSSGCNNLNVNVSASVDLTICDEDLLIPDGFSPNGDNINDNFEILHLSELYPKFKLEIYNRYGNILYKGNINTPNWNGTSSEGGIKMGNGVVPVGVYFYILEFNDGTRKPTQGRLYLSR